MSRGKEEECIYVLKTRTKAIQDGLDPSQVYCPVQGNCDRTGFNCPLCEYANIMLDESIENPPYERIKVECQPEQPVVPIERFNHKVKEWASLNGIEVAPEQG